MLREHILGEDTPVTGRGLDWIYPESRIRRDMKMFLELDIRVCWDERKNDWYSIEWTELISEDVVRW